MVAYICALALDSFSLGPFAWEHSLGHFHLDMFNLVTFAWELSLDRVRLGSALWNFHLGCFAWELSLGSARLITCDLDSSAWKNLFGTLRLGTFDRERLLDIFCLRVLVRKVSVDIQFGQFSMVFPHGVFRLASFAWELSLGIFGLGTFVWDFRSGTFAWDPSLENLRLECFVHICWLIG